MKDVSVFDLMNNYSDSKDDHIPDGVADSKKGGKSKGIINNPTSPATVPNGMDINANEPVKIVKKIYRFEIVDAFSPISISNGNFEQNDTTKSKIQNTDTNCQTVNELGPQPSQKQSQTLTNGRAVSPEMQKTNNPKSTKKPVLSDDNGNNSVKVSVVKSGEPSNSISPISTRTRSKSAVSKKSVSVKVKQESRKSEPIIHMQSSPSRPKTCGPNSAIRSTNKAQDGFSKTTKRPKTLPLENFSDKLQVQPLKSVTKVSRKNPRSDDDPIRIVSKENSQIVSSDPDGLNCSKNKTNRPKSSASPRSSMKDKTVSKPPIAPISLNKLQTSHTRPKSEIHQKQRDISRSTTPQDRPMARTPESPRSKKLPPTRKLKTPLGKAGTPRTSSDQDSVFSELETIHLDEDEFDEDEFDEEKALEARRQSAEVDNRLRNYWSSFGTSITKIHDKTDSFSMQPRKTFKSSDGFKGVMTDMFGNSEYGRAKSYTMLKKKINRLANVSGVASKLFASIAKPAEAADEGEDEEEETDEDEKHEEIVSEIQGAKRGWKLLKRHVQETTMEENAKDSHVKWSMIRHHLNSVSDLGKARQDLYERYGLIPSIQEDGSLQCKNVMWSQRAVSLGQTDPRLYNTKNYSKETVKQRTQSARPKSAKNTHDPISKPRSATAKLSRLR